MHCSCEACRAKVKAMRARGRANRYAPKVGTSVVVRHADLAAVPFGGRPTTIEEAVELASWIIAAILGGAVDARTGREAVQAVQAFKAVVATRDLTAHKLDKLKRELRAEFEQQLARLKGKVP